MPIGITTLPPSDERLERVCRLRVGFGASESAKPSNFGLPVLRPSEIMTPVSPILMQECITLFSLPGVHIDLSGASFQRISMATLASTAFL